MDAPNDAVAEEPRPRQGSEPIDTSSEAHRHACEARWVAALPSHDARADYLAQVAARRGPAAAHHLRRTAWQILNPAPLHDCVGDGGKSNTL